MNLLNLRKRKKKQKKNIFDDEASGKKQFNVVINAEIKDAIDQMAKQFRLNKSVTTEHLLQIGLYYTAIATKDPEKRERIEQHLIQAHLLDQPADDEEVVIRLVEPNQNWMLLAHSKQVVAKAVRLKNVLDQVRKTGDFGLAERAKKEVYRTILEFADYLIKHRLDNVEDESRF